MTDRNKTARLAGIIYTIVAISGIFGLMYVPSKLTVWGNASTTFSNITNSELLFRLGIASVLISYIFFLFLPFVLYQLLKPVNKMMAKLMLALALISVTLSFIPISHKFDVLTLIDNADYLKIYSAEQLQSQIMFSLASYNNETRIAMLFWGLWLFPFGYLVFKSKFLPKLLGAFLMLGCFGYLIHVFGRLIFINYTELGISSFITLPAAIGELGICLWLLIMGTNKLNVGKKADNKV